jgi:NAD(P)-dependent dehydrogenase (short-subunit alcohol dehydrogenase family)
MLIMPVVTSPVLSDTVALVTGSSSGIGAATAQRLAAEGAAVAVVARRRDRLDEVASAIQADGGTALVIAADVTRQSDAIAAVDQAVAELGRLDTVVNNAGVKAFSGQPGSRPSQLSYCGPTTSPMPSLTSLPATGAWR